MNNNFRKQLVGMGLGQALCLAVGLFIHYQYVTSQLDQSTTPTADRADVAAQSKALASASSDTLPGPHTPDSKSVSLVGIGVLTFVWVTGLQSAILFLVLSAVGKKQVGFDLKRDEHAILKTEALVRTRDAVIFGLAKLAESRDPETGQHLERIALYSQQLARAAAQHPSFRNRISSKFIHSIAVSSALHDIGKVAVKDQILLKPGKLSWREHREIQQHVGVGARCIEQISRRLGNSDFLHMAYEIAKSHHEKWDGGGYPEGLAGEQIPLAARIVAIADVYDALSVRRVYKDPFPHDECVAIIRSDSGSHFDPDLVDVFLQLEPEFRRIAAQFADAETQPPQSSETTADETKVEQVASGIARAVSDVLENDDVAAQTLLTTLISGDTNDSA